jgi:hypothetical protein
MAFSPSGAIRLWLGVSYRPKAQFGKPLVLHAGYGNTVGTSARADDLLVAETLEPLKLPADVAHDGYHELRIFEIFINLNRGPS